MEDKIKASNITDQEILDAMVKTIYPETRWSFTWDIQEVLKQYPPKVVLAKLKSMKKRKIIDGCECGCRGDWERMK